MYYSISIFYLNIVESCHKEEKFHIWISFGLLIASSNPR
ncbi:hypothetical protein B4110_1486 [Parageobacillus toebii]|uniref:Uncharacterized protein n=1 Tax=Parageobacillus toebii TaxID=153151 RepID=A0A150N216_9BACL|nr:hypothetical protein B4110_1486 [Parageobacillus toebii]